MPKLMKISADPAYRAYLELQLKRTLSKKDAPLQLRTRILVDKLASLMPLDRCDVLCVGCRNFAELDYFESKGARSVTGIDLYSEDPRILVMDMHHLEFSSDSFDVIYSSHSLEHALYPQQVATEFTRVIRSGGYIVVEVPTQFEARGADLVDYGQIDVLLGLFKSGEEQIVWSESLTADNDKAEVSTGTIRLVIRAGE